MRGIIELIRKHPKIRRILRCESPYFHHWYIIQSFCRTQLFANDFFNRCVSCFNGLPESVVLSKTVAEFKRRLSEVDLLSFLKYNVNNSTGYT